MIGRFLSLPVLSESETALVPARRLPCGAVPVRGSILHSSSPWWRVLQLKLSQLDILIDKIPRDPRARSLLHVQGEPDKYEMLIFRRARGIPMEPGNKYAPHRQCPIVCNNSPALRAPEDKHLILRNAKERDSRQVHTQ